MLKQVLSVSLVGSDSTLTDPFNSLFLLDDDEPDGIGSLVQEDLHIRLSVVTSLASL